MTRHLERYKNKDGEYINFGNQEIDTNKSHLNYNLVEEKISWNLLKRELVMLDA